MYNYVCFFKEKCVRKVYY